MFIKGSGITCVCIISETQLLVRLGNIKKIAIIDDWKTIKMIDNPEFLGFLRTHHFLPGFNMESFPFALAYEKETIDLINLKTAHKDTFIQGSA